MADDLHPAPAAAPAPAQAHVTRGERLRVEAMELECFPLVARPPEIVPGRAQRGWMDRFAQRHPYRCLPLTVANTTGWEILCPMGFTAEWNGGLLAEDITLRPDRPHPDFHDFAKSHFTGGVLTLHTGYLFRTAPGWDMWCQGPPNLPKDGVQPLQGLTETDWLPFPFTMNWLFTRPGRIRFEKGEPFCFITLAPHRAMDEVQPVMRPLSSEPEMRGQYEAWVKMRDEFNARIAKRDPEAMREAWQRLYFTGEMPADAPQEGRPADHVNKRRLKSPRLSR